MLISKLADVAWAPVCDRSRFGFEPMTGRKRGSFVASGRVEARATGSAPALPVQTGVVMRHTVLGTTGSVNTVQSHTYIPNHPGSRSCRPPV